MCEHTSYMRTILQTTKHILGMKGLHIHSHKTFF